MLAVFEKDGFLHPIKWTGRVALHAGAIAYCKAEENAAHGVLQVPDQVLTHGLPFTIEPGRKLPVCPVCRTAVMSAIA